MFVLIPISVCAPVCKHVHAGVCVGVFVCMGGQKTCFIVDLLHPVILTHFIQTRILTHTETIHLSCEI